MGTRVDVLLWANRTCIRAAIAAPHELLEIPPDATLEAAQDAFHKIARVSHPDLHRGLQPDELERVTTAYATIANAYQAFRTAKLAGRPAPLGLRPRARRRRRAGKPATAAPPTPTTPPITAAAKPAANMPAANMPAATRPTGGSQPLRKPTEPPPLGGAARNDPSSDFAAEPVSTTSLTTSVNASQQMSAKALVYYRKAEIALRRGDLRGALLNVKLAIAADPQSQFLRQALLKVEQELKQPP